MREKHVIIFTMQWTDHFSRSLEMIIQLCRSSEAPLNEDFSETINLNQLLEILSGKTMRTHQLVSNNRPLRERCGHFRR